MTKAVNMNLQLNFDQVLSLAMQLPESARLALSRELARSSRVMKLRQIRELFKCDEISEEEIRQECEAVRKEMYESQKAKS